MRGDARYLAAMHRHVMRDDPPAPRPDNATARLGHRNTLPRPRRFNRHGGGLRGARNSVGLAHIEFAAPRFRRAAEHRPGLVAEIVGDV